MGLIAELVGGRGVENFLDDGGGTLNPCPPPALPKKKIKIRESLKDVLIKSLHLPLAKTL